ncbi:MAG: MATE family efflux transporter [Gemmatimonadales bacterium]
MSIYTAMRSTISARLDRDIARLAIPALGALAADPLVSMVDTVFVGRLGVVPLAALGVNTSIFAMAFVVFNFLAYGTTPLVARAVGRGDRAAAGDVVMQAFLLAAIVGGAAMLLLELLAVPILALMGAGGELRDPALSYLRIRALAGPAVLFVTAGHGAFRGYQDTRTPLLVTLGLNLVNLVLDPLFIFGFGWGLEGAAVATLIAQWGGALWFIHLLLRSRSRELGIQPRLPALSEIRPFLRVGGELALRTVALIGTLTLATAVATRIGTVQVAAHQVATQIWLLLAMTVDSLAVAAQALVAGYRGSGDAAMARRASNRLLAWGLISGIALGGLFFLLAPVLPRLFTDEPAVLAAVAGIFPFIVAMQPLNAVVFVWDGVFIGAERFRFLARQMAFSAACAAVILFLVLPLGWGLTGVWWGIVALMVARAVTLAIAYRNPRLLSTSR